MDGVVKPMLRTGIVILAALLLGLVSAAGQSPAPVSAGTGTRRLYAGSAYGIGVWSWSGEQEYGPSANVSFSCTSSTALHKTTTGVGPTLGVRSLWRSGTSRTTVETSAVPVRSRTNATTPTSSLSTVWSVPAR